MVPKSERFEMRLDQQTLDEVDEWRSGQRDVPSRSEAIRRLVESALTQSRAKPNLPIRFSGGEKLMLFMLRDLYKHHNVEGEIDPEFVADVIGGGHYWGLEWQYSGIFHRHEDNPALVSQVVDILDMWSFVETGYNALSMEDKNRVELEAAPFGKHVYFAGFDGNNESEYISITRFLVERLERFPFLKGRGLNCHHPSIQIHMRMVSTFLPIRAKLIGRELTASEIIDILKERTHPENRKKS